MLLKITRLTCYFAMLSVASTGNTEVVWTGAVSSDIKDDANYDFSNSTLTTLGPMGATDIGTGFFRGLLDDRGGITDSIVFGDAGTAPEIPNESPQFNYGSVVGTTFDGVTATLESGARNGWNAGVAISLINGADVSAFFLIAKSPEEFQTLTIDATSSLTLGGPGNPLTDVLTINLAPGAMVELTKEAITDPGGWLFHDQKFFVNGAPLIDGVNANVVSTPSGQGVVVTAILDPASVGDFDDNGVVNGDDLTEWQSHYGTDLDGGDFLTWQRNFTGNPSPFRVAISSVPEPASASLVLLAIATVITRRQKSSIKVQ